MGILSLKIDVSALAWPTLSQTCCRTNWPGGQRTTGWPAHCKHKSDLCKYYELLHMRTNILLARRKSYAVLPRRFIKRNTTWNSLGLSSHVAITGRRSFYPQLSISIYSSIQPSELNNAEWTHLPKVRHVCCRIRPCVNCSNNNATTFVPFTSSLKANEIIGKMHNIIIDNYLL